MDKKPTKTLTGIIIAGIALFASLFLAVGAVMAWFIVGGNATAGLDNVSVGSPDIRSLECCFYRSDGVRYDLKTGVSYDNDGAELGVDFFMPEYDTIITEKNSSNNLILEAKVGLFESSANRRLKIEMTTAFGDLFGGSTNGLYNLSDVIKIGMLAEPDLTGAASNLEIYSAATESFGIVAESEKQRFATLGADNEAAKTAACSFTCEIPAGGGNTFLLYFNLEYDEPLIKKLYGAGYGEFDSAGKDKLTLRSDLKFVFTTEAAGHA